MPLYKYLARPTEGGKQVNGSLEASSVEEAVLQLSGMGLLPSKIESKSAKKQGKAVKMEELIRFTMEASALTSAGIPLITTMQKLADISGTQLSTAAGGIVAKLKEGACLSAAMEVYSKTFPATYRMIIEAGELSGRLDSALSRIANMLEQQLAAERQIKDALRYPKLLAGTVMGAMFIICFGILPRLTSALSTARVELPLPTKLLMAAGSIISQYYLQGLVFIATATGAAYLYSSSKTGSLQRDKLLLHLPIFSDTIRQLEFSRFFHTLASLIRSGIGLPESIESSARSSDNCYLTMLLSKMGAEIRDGATFKETLQATGQTPQVALEMAAAGEEAGQLDHMLELAAKYMEDSASTNTKRMTSLIEPMLLLLLAGVVLFVALAVFMPIWNITSLTH